MHYLLLGHFPELAYVLQLGVHIEHARMLGEAERDSEKGSSRKRETPWKASAMRDWE